MVKIVEKEEEKKFKIKIPWKIIAIVSILALICVVIYFLALPGISQWCTIKTWEEMANRIREANSGLRFEIKDDYLVCNLESNLNR